MHDSLTSAEFARDPYPVYRQLRAEGDVVWDESRQAFYAVSYTAVRSLLARDVTAARGVPPGAAALPEEQRAIVQPVEEFYAQWLVFSDTREHRVLRGALRPALSGRASAALNALLEEETWRTVARASVDPIASLANPLAERALREVLGVDPDESAYLHRLSGDLIGYLIAPDFDVPSALVAAAAADELEGFVSEALAKRRGPVMPALHDLVEAGDISILVATAAVAQFLTGAVEPTATLVTGMLEAVRQQPKVAAALEAGTLPVRDVVEEALRHDPPFHYAPRTARTSGTLCGTPVQAGQRVVVVLASANRDEAVGPDPDRFDPWRKPAVRHVTFGVGDHSCLGASLARLQAATTLEAAVGTGIIARLGPVSRVPSVGGTRYAFAG